MVFKFIHELGVNSYRMNSLLFVKTFPNPQQIMIVSWHGRPVEKLTEIRPENGHNAI